MHLCPRYIPRNAIDKLERDNNGVQGKKSGIIAITCLIIFFSSFRFACVLHWVLVYWQSRYRLSIECEFMNKDGYARNMSVSVAAT